MLIGKFAEKFNVKPDTIRYYMELGLIIPKKRNAYYEFDKTCETDMTLIMELKEYQFSLQEIHKFLSLKRVTLLSNREDYTFLTGMLEEKKKELKRNIRNINQSIGAINEKIRELKEIHTQESENKGMPFAFLPMLYCPKCQVALDLKNASTRGQHIFMGELYCDACGYKAQIHEGIVITEHINKESYNPHYIYDKEMLKIIQSSFISLSEKASLWVTERLLSQNLTNKVVIETHIDTYVFLNKYIEELDKSAFYIFTGSTMPMLKILKEKVEQIDPEMKILYLLNSGLDLPIQRGTIDIVIDSYSSNEYALFHRSLPMKSIQPYLKESSKIIGASFYYHEGDQSITKMKELYPNAYPGNLHSYFMKENLEAIQFHINEKADIGSTNNPGSYIKYHVPGEKGYFFTYMASKR